MGVGDVRYGSVPKESTLDVVDSVEDLRDKVPADLYEMVARSARQPTVEELDI
jgi:EXLDI family protein